MPRPPPENDPGVEMESPRDDGTMSFRFLHCTYVVKDRQGNEKLLLDDVSAHCDAGNVLAIMGPSGAGKSTLLSMLTLSKGGGRPFGVLTLGGVELTPAIYRAPVAGEAIEVRQCLP